jgi:hypothetical protein
VLGDKGLWLRLSEGGWVYSELLKRDVNKKNESAPEIDLSEDGSRTGRKWELLTLSGITFSLQEISKHDAVRIDESLVTLLEHFKLYLLTARIPATSPYEVELSFKKGEIILELESGERYENLKLDELGKAVSVKWETDTVKVEPSSTGGCLLFFDPDLPSSEIRHAYIYINDRPQKLYEIK